ncbi:MAG: glycosyltransferase family 2 protein [Pseudomonadota bacterium]|jgi:GT2 family glycosyltransferase
MSLLEKPLPIPSLTVSVVSHGQRDMVAALVLQLAGLLDPSLTRVVVIHNLPDADLPKPPDAIFELVQLHNPEPLGFSANHNRAFAHCETPYFAVLNPDIELQFGNPFPALLDAMFRDERLGAVAPALVQPTTLHIEPNRGLVTPWEIVRRRMPGHQPPKEPAWLVGAFVFIRTIAYRELGGFDERFRLYCEDVDLGVRLCKRGWNIRRIDTVRALHRTQRSSHKSMKYMWFHSLSILKIWIKFIHYAKADETAGRRKL